MPDLPRSHLAIYAAAFVAIALLGARQLARGGAAAPAQAPPAAIRVAEGESATPERLVVHVAGEVARPGVYRLRAGQRVDDAVRRAGGPTRRADLDALNLAAEVQDGRQVMVPRRAVAGRAPPPPGAAAAVPGGGGAEGAPVNLNTATLEQLDTLAGVGPATAQKILAFREANGGFTSVEQLAQVPGIGEKRLAALREQVTL